MMKRTVRALGVFVAIAGWLQAKDVGLLPVPAKAGESGLESSADKFEVDQKTGWITFSGHVVVRTGEHELRADRVKLHQEKGDVQAKGNVEIRQTGFGTWKGDYIEYNYKTGKGLTGAGNVQVGAVRVFTHEVSRREDGRYDAKDIQVTTCTNAPGSWHWHVAGDGRFRDNDYVVVYNAVPYLFGLPFGYMPYWYRDIDTHYGIRLIPGYTSKWGAYLMGGYVYNVYESPRDNGPQLDATTHLDYRTKRGVGAGQNFHWDLKDWGKGKLETYYAWDQDPPDDLEDRNWISDVNSERYRIRFRHEVDLTPRDQMFVRASYLSDSQVNSDFFRRDHRSESTPVNIAAYEHREHTWAAGVTASGRLNEFYSSVNRLPEGWLNVEPQPVFGTGLNYESQTRAGYLNRDAAKYENADAAYMYYPGSWADYSVTRVDTAHRLTCPLRLGDVVSVVPRAGFRETYYSDTEYETDVYRSSAELGVEVSARGTADFKNGYRHVIEPYVDYSYQPTHFDEEDGRVYSVDHYDRSFEWFDQLGFDGTWLPYDWHGVRPGLRNLLQKPNEHNRMRTLAEWDVFAGVQFDSEGNLNEKGLRLLGSKTVLSPTEALDIKAHAEWDTEKEVVAYADLSAFYKVNEKFRLGGGYLGRDHDLYDYDYSVIDEWNRVKENLLYGGFTHDINDTWSWSLYTRYDVRINDLDEVGGYVLYKLDCLVFQLRVSYENDYQRIDGVSEDSSDFRVSLMVWLRAEGREPDDEWMSW